MKDKISEYFKNSLKVVDNYIFRTARGVPVMGGLPGDFAPPIKLLDYRQGLDAHRRNIDVSRFGLHFYNHAANFDEPPWSRLEETFDMFSKFQCVIAPPFRSGRAEYAFQNVADVCSSRLVGQILQRFDVRVVPCVSWGSEDALDLCLDGLPERCVASISTDAIARGNCDDEQRRLFQDACRRLANRLHPKLVLLYGAVVPGLFVDDDAQIVEYPTDAVQTSFSFLSEQDF